MYLLHSSTDQTLPSLLAGPLSGSRFLANHSCLLFGTDILCSAQTEVIINNNNNTWTDTFFWIQVAL